VSLASLSLSLSLSPSLSRELLYHASVVVVRRGAREEKRREESKTREENTKQCKTGVKMLKREHMFWSCSV